MEPNETIVLNNITGSAVTVGDADHDETTQSSTTYTIRDDDTLTVEFSQATGSDLESTGGNLPQLLVTGQVQAGYSVTVSVAVDGSGTASGAGTDYHDPTTLTVIGGTYAAQAFAIPGLAVVNDSIVEPNETIVLNSITAAR